MKVQVTTLDNCELVIFAENEEKKELAFEILHSNADESKETIMQLLTDAGFLFSEYTGFIIGARPKGIPGR